MRERNLFLGGLSHELRAPLNAIIGFSEILASGTLPSQSPKREQFAEHIHQSGRRLLRLINDVMQLSRVDAGEYQFVPERVNVGELIAGVADLLHTRLVRKSLTLTVEVEHALTEVMVDPGSLKQALLAHLSHAAEMAVDGARIAVRAQAQEPERFRLEVQLHRSRAGDGQSAMECTPEQAIDSTKLDLTLARRLVEAQGGEMGQSIGPGEGATWYLVLNRRQGYCQTVGEQPEPQRQTAARSSSV